MATPLRQAHKSKMSPYKDLPPLCLTSVIVLHFIILLCESPCAMLRTCRWENDLQELVLSTLCMVAITFTHWAIPPALPNHLLSPVSHPLFSGFTFAEFPISSECCPSLILFGSKKKIIGLMLIFGFEYLSIVWFGNRVYEIFTVLCSYKCQIIDVYVT